MIILINQQHPIIPQLYPTKRYNFNLFLLTFSYIQEPSQPVDVQPKVDKKKPQPDEDQFIFQTVPDDQFEGDFKSRDKTNLKSQEYYSQQSYKKDWDKYYEKDKPNEKTSNLKPSHKKQTQNFQTKRKTQSMLEEPSMRPNIHAQIPPPQPIGFYPHVPTVPNAYLPPGYYPPYEPQPGVRHPYGMYPPQLHQPLTNIYMVPPPQGPYPVPNPHMYQIPPPPIPYGTIPIVLPVPQMYRMEHHPIIQNRQIPHQKSKSFPYEGPITTRTQSESPYNQPGKFVTSVQKQTISRQRQDPRQFFQTRDKSHQQLRYAQERQRSRDRKDYKDHESTKMQRKERHNQKNSYESRPYNDLSGKERRQNQIPSSQIEKKTIKEQKKSQQQQLRGKLKKQVGKNLKVLFGTNNEEQQEFLFLLRDVLKYRLLKRQEEQLLRLNNFQTAKPMPIYSQNKQVIESNHQKALLKLENFIITLSQQQKILNSELLVKKRESLFKLLSSLQLDDLITKIKEMRLKKKLIGQRKMSEIKRLLQQLVRDPRKRIK